MAPSAQYQHLNPSHVVELVQWLEDVAADGSRARAVTLADGQSARRTATLRAFYESIVRHPRFGRAWPESLPAGSLAPRFPPNRDDTPNGLVWMSITCSGEPVAEPAQYLSQFQALRVLPDHDEWIYLLPYLVVEGVCASPQFESAADYADQALGVIGDPQGKDSAQIRTIIRDLDAHIEAYPLLADGGVLEQDGPRLRSRALFAAAWLQRFARRTPVVLVIDEAQHAGPFVTELVQQLSIARAPILIVLAGTPAGWRSSMPSSERGIDGPLGSLTTSVVAPCGLPAGEPGRVIGLLATALPSTLFTFGHLEGAARIVGATTGPHHLLDELIAAGWVRVLDEPVYAFVDDEHRCAARDAALAMAETGADADRRRLCDEVAAKTGRENLLERTVAMRAAITCHGPLNYSPFEAARLLALQGDIQGAISLAGLPSTPLEMAVLAAWHQATGRRHLNPDDLPNEIPLDAETLLVHAALLARFHPTVARAKLARALDQIGGGEQAGRLRFAAVRIGLALGDLACVDRALGADGRAIATARTVGEIDRLGQWSWQRGFVARSIEVLANLVGIANLRHHAPESAALGHLLTARLALLERLDRITTADDATYIANEAVAVFARFRGEVPHDEWAAMTWRSWVRHRQGHHELALRELDEIAADQSRALGPASAERFRTLVRKGRCLVEAGLMDRAHELLHEVRDALAEPAMSEPATLADARQWHAETLAAAGDFAGAASELSGVVAWRAANLPPDDEDLLFSRHRYAFCALRAGTAMIAAAQMREVVGRRAELDLPDSPRLLAARQSFGAYLLQIGRADESIEELQEVVRHRATALTPEDRLLIGARAELAGCLLVLGRLGEAAVELEQVIAQNRAAQRTDLQSLVAREQYAMCVWVGGDVEEAQAQLDGVLHDALVALPPDHPFIEHVRSVQRPNAPALAAE